MKKMILMIPVLLLFACTTKYNYIDTGTCIGYYDGNVYEYLKQDRGNWDSITRVIEKCSPEVQTLLKEEKITFLGPKNIAFEKFFFWSHPDHVSDDVVNYNKEGYTCIDEFPREFCDKIVKSHLAKGVYLRDEVPRVEKDDEGQHTGGGVVLTAMDRNKIWVWTIRNPYAGVAEMGDVELRLASVKLDGKTIIHNLGAIATTDLRAENGVVHALADRYFLGQMFE